MLAAVSRVPNGLAVGQLIAGRSVVAKTHRAICNAFDALCDGVLGADPYLAKVRYLDALQRLNQSEVRAAIRLAGRKRR